MHIVDWLKRKQRGIEQQKKIKRRKKIEARQREREKEILSHYMPDLQKNRSQYLNDKQTIEILIGDFVTTTTESIKTGIQDLTLVDGILKHHNTQLKDLCKSPAESSQDSTEISENTEFKKNIQTKLLDFIKNITEFHINLAEYYAQKNSRAYKDYKKLIQTCPIGNNNHDYQPVETEDYWDANLEDTKGKDVFKKWCVNLMPQTGGNEGQHGGRPPLPRSHLNTNITKCSKCGLINICNYKDKDMKDEYPRRFCSKIEKGTQRANEITPKEQEAYKDKLNRTFIEHFNRMHDFHTAIETLLTNEILELRNLLEGYHNNFVEYLTANLNKDKEHFDIFTIDNGYIDVLIYEFIKNIDILHEETIERVADTNNCDTYNNLKNKCPERNDALHTFITTDNEQNEEYQGPLTTACEDCGIDRTDTQKEYTYIKERYNKLTPGQYYLSNAYYVKCEPTGGASKKGRKKIKKTRKLTSKNKSIKQKKKTKRRKLTNKNKRRKSTSKNKRRKKHTNRKK